MGRTLDNAMLNVGLKDIAKGLSNSIDPRPVLRANFNHSWAKGIGLSN